MSQGMYIDGHWCGGAAGATRAIHNPLDQQVLETVAEGDAEDARAAVRAARRAFDDGTWPATRPKERAGLLVALAGLVERDRAALARTETLDTGKTLTESHADLDNVVSVLDYYAGLAGEAGRVLPEPGGPATRSLVTTEPVGVCAQISPWNYPLMQAVWKLAPALAAGNTIVVKPSELTPLSTIHFFGLLQEAGFPPGVANLVLGPGATVGEHLAASHAVDLVSFTGGLATGRRVMVAASGNVKRIALELGGKNPNVVFADADLDTAVDNALAAAFMHAGQVCSAGARLLVADEVHDEVVEALARRAEEIRLGDGLDAGTGSGPLISAEQRAKVERYVELGLAEGATLRAGGCRPEDPALARGFFYRPTVLTGCHAGMRIVQEEVFGPVLTVESFHTEAEAVDRANDTIYGLAGAVWTGDRGRAARVARALRLGTVWINDYHPYFAQTEWGGYKQSGIGRELGPRGLEEYVEVKHVFENLAPRPSGWFGG